MNKLSIIKDGKGTKIMLDDKEIQCVKEYQVKGSAKGSTELTLVMDVTLDGIKETAPEVPVQEQLECSYLGCKNTDTVLDDVEVAPGKIEKHYVCKKHVGTLNTNITVDSNVIS